MQFKARLAKNIVGAWRIVLSMAAPIETQAEPYPHCSQFVCMGNLRGDQGFA